MQIYRMPIQENGRESLRCFINDWSFTFSKPLRPAVLVLPGGAYVMNSNAEGEPIALAFAAQGFQSFVLHYSTGRYAGFPNPLADVSMALKTIREHAEEWSIDPDRIAVCGFSAGGHLAACLGTMWDSEDVMRASGCFAGENRPNALVLGYPCIFVDYEGNPEMWDRLRGGLSVAELKERLSAELHVSEKTPPCFIFSMYEDQMVPVEHSLRFASALAAKNVPFELHCFQHGVHGSALFDPSTSLGAVENEDRDAAQWFPLCVDWLRALLGTPGFETPPEPFGLIGDGRAQVGVPLPVKF